MDATGLEPATSGYAGALTRVTVDLSGPLD